MIYIFLGNDTKRKNSQVKKIVKEKEFLKLPAREISKELIMNQAESQSLFGDSPIFLSENILTEGDISFSKEDLEILKNSENLFIFLEDKLSSAEQKKYLKYASLESFEEKVVKPVPKVNLFGIADSFAKRDKITTWVLYTEAIESTEPEAISGILFWKIKTMLLNGTKNFSLKELKDQSSKIVSIYHLAHRGEIDFRIGLEQFILSSLNK
jgi:hypothetical protein